MLRNKKGQGLVEMALVLPILLLILMGIIEGGFLFGTKLELQNAARDGARWASIGMKNTDVINSIRSGFVILKNKTEEEVPIDIILSDDGKSKTVTVNYEYDSVTPLGLGDGKNIGTSVTMRLE